MTGFPLLDLGSFDLEKIISKLEGKSYCRLQQTCKDLKNFIVSSRKTSVLLHGHYETIFYYPVEERKGLANEFGIGRRFRPANLDLEGSYGIRLNSLWIRKTPFEPFCDMVKKYRITCRILIKNSPTDKEGLKMLLDLLKPVEIDMDLYGSIDSLETLYESKIIKKVRVSLNTDEVLKVASKLLSHFEDLHIHVGMERKNQYPLLQSVLELFLSEPWPGLHRFKFTVIFVTRFPNEESVKQLFPGIGIKERERSNMEVVYDLEDLPQHIPQGALCQFVVQFEMGSIIFVRNTQCTT